LAKVKNTFWNGYALWLWLVLAAWLPPVVGHSQQLCGFDHQLTLWLQNDVNRQEWERTEKAIFERYEQRGGLGKREYNNYTWDKIRPKNITDCGSNTIFINI
jgi:hypothetical protein